LELKAKNVHQLLPTVLNALRKDGIHRDSRNGPVLVYPEPVTITYTSPCERVMFWPERDCNPALHLYESLWMIRGRNDVEPLVRYAKQFRNYSDDGQVMHGAYGHRWRRHFGRDQLTIIADRLRRNSDDRRCVLSMWDARADLDREGKDVPCNTIATFQRDHNGTLDLTVFNRSNDLIWGLTGANAVHFSFLLEYMATLIGCPVGRYHQISTNMHAYINTLEPLAAITRVDVDPYARVRHIPLPLDPWATDDEIESVVACADGSYRAMKSTWGKMAWAVLYANHTWRTSKKEERFSAANRILDQSPSSDLTDWVVAQREWFERRQRAWEAKGGE